MFRLTKVINLAVNEEELHQIMRLCEIYWGKRKRMQEGWKFEFMVDEQKFHVSIIDSKKIIIQPADSQLITKVEEKINSIIKTALIPYKNDKTPHATHARNMLNRLKEFNLEHEIDRCAIIILVDAAIEILLRSRIDQIAKKENLRIDSKNLTKRIELYDIIENNGYLLPFKDDIDNIRSKIRNDVMHLGKIPTKETTEYCLLILEKLLKF